MGEQGVFARIPLEDVTLAEAAGMVDDDTFFQDTRIAILFHFPQVGLEGYWSLRVGDHRDMVAFLIQRGLYGES